MGLKFKAHVFVRTFWRLFIFQETSSRAFLWYLPFSISSILADLLRASTFYFWWNHKLPPRFPENPSSYGVAPLPVCNHGGKLSRFSLESPNQKSIFNNPSGHERVSILGRGNTPPKSWYLPVDFLVYLRPSCLVAPAHLFTRPGEKK